MSIAKCSTSLAGVLHASSLGVVFDQHAQLSSSSHLSESPACVHAQHPAQQRPGCRGFSRVSWAVLCLRSQMSRFQAHYKPRALLRAVTVVGALAIIMLVTPVVIVGMIPLVFVYAGMQMRYIKTSRELKRLQSIALSPIFSHLNESLQVGASNCRARQGRDARSCNIDMPAWIDEQRRVCAACECQAIEADA